MPTLRLAHRTHRRGAIFIVALAITVVLSAMLLVYAQEMQTEGTVSANRLAAVQADAVEQGAEQWVLAEVEANTTPTSGASTSSTTAVDPTTIPAEGLQIGNSGYFWLLHPDPAQDQTYAFGLVDECSKVSLNSPRASSQLPYLPNMTQDIADSVTSWISTTGEAVGNGSGDSYYNSLPEPYSLKRDPFETVDEMLLIKDVTPNILYGYDLNHDGVMTADEQAASNGAAVTNGTTSDSRGVFNYVTVYSKAQIFPNGPIVQGLINVNTAPEAVLMSLGISQSDAENIVSTRKSSPTTGKQWVQTIIPTTFAAINPLIVGSSNQYSADIVAVSSDGRAYKRVRIVVDSRTQPARILYRKDITNLGWPLPTQVRDSLRSGKGVPVDMTGTSNVQGNS